MKSAMQHRAFLAYFIALGGMISCVSAAPQSHQESFDLGKIEGAKAYEHLFEFKNPFGATFRIDQTSKSCSCTSVEYDKKEYAPAEVLRVKVTCDTRNKGFGPYTVKVLLIDQAEPRREIVLTVTGTLPLNAQLKSSLPAVSLGTLGPQGVVERELTISRWDNTPLLLQEFRTSHACLRVRRRGEASNAETSADFVLAFDARGLPPGIVDANVTFVTRHPTHAEIRVAVRGEVIGYVRPDKSKLFLGRMPKDEVQEWRVTLESEKPFDIVNHGTTLDEPFRLYWARGTHGLTLRYAGGGSEGLVNGELNVTVRVESGDGPCHEVISIPVMGFIAANQEQDSGKSMPAGGRIVHVREAGGATPQLTHLHVVDKTGVVFSGNVDPPATVRLSGREAAAAAVTWRTAPQAQGRTWTPTLGFHLPPDDGKAQDITVEIPHGTAACEGNIARAPDSDQAVRVYRILIVYPQDNGVLVYHRHLQQEPPITGPFRFEGLPPGRCDVIAIGRANDQAYARHHAITLHESTPAHLDVLAPERGTGLIRGKIAFEASGSNTAFKICLRPADASRLDWDDLLELGVRDAVVATDAVTKDGAFVLKDIAAGDYVLTVVQLPLVEGLPTGAALHQASQQVRVESATPTVVNVVLQ